MTRPRAILFLLTAALLWSMSGVLIKSVAWNPLAIAGVRSAFGALAIMALYRPLSFRWSRQQWIAGAAFSTNVILFVSATKLTTAANAIVLQYTAPIWVAVLGPFVLKERSTRFDWATILVAVGGMGLFFMDRLTPEHVLGNILALLSGVAYAWSTITLRQQKQGSPMAAVILGNLITASVASPFCFAGAAPPIQGWVILAVLGVFQLGLANFFYVRALQHVNALEAISIPFIEPVLNPIWVFLVVGEKPGPMASIGGAVVLGSVLLRVFAPAARRQLARISTIFGA